MTPAGFAEGYRVSESRNEAGSASDPECRSTSGGAGVHASSGRTPFGSRSPRSPRDSGGETEPRFEAGPTRSHGWPNGPVPTSKPASRPAWAGSTFSASRAPDCPPIKIVICSGEPRSHDRLICSLHPSCERSEAIESVVWNAGLLRYARNGGASECPAECRTVRRSDPARDRLAGSRSRTDRLRLGRRNHAK